MAVPGTASGYNYTVGAFSKGTKDKAWFYPSGTGDFDCSGVRVAL